MVITAQAIRATVTATPTAPAESRSRRRRPSRRRSSASRSSVEEGTDAAACSSSCLVSSIVVSQLCSQGRSCAGGQHPDRGWPYAQRTCCLLGREVEEVGQHDGGTLSRRAGAERAH